MSHDKSAARASRSTVLTHVGGLHARPSIMLTQVANRFASKVWIGLSDRGPWTDAKSIARVMAMKTPSQTTVFFAAEGADASDAVSALARLVQNDFLNPNDQ
jgi:phosphocarrier protein HPr